MNKLLIAVIVICVPVTIALWIYTFQPSTTQKTITPLTTINSPSTPIPTVIPSTPVPTPLPSATPQSMVLEVPFTSQAPLAEWSDPLQQDGCEEASSLMAVMWARNQELNSGEAYKNKIIEVSHWEQSEYGIAKDTSAKDTVERIFKGFFKYYKAHTITIHSFQEIVDSLTRGYLVIIPANGQKVGNPHYTPPGPERHMIVIKGYDLKTSEFITNDPGTRLGEGFRYNFQKLYDAIRDYPTGDHQPISGNNKVIIVVEKDPSFL